MYFSVIVINWDNGKHGMFGEYILLDIYSNLDYGDSASNIIGGISPGHR